MNDKVVIVDAIRTPIGKFMGALSDIKSHELGGMLIRELIYRNKLDDKIIDEIIIGQIAGFEPKGNPAREALLYAGVDEKVSAFTINKNCASGLKSVSIASAMIASGYGEVYIAGGMENMSSMPHLLKSTRKGFKMGNVEMVDYLTELLSGMGLTAEAVAEKYKISREEQDLYACRSHELALLAQKNGRFDSQIIPVEYNVKGKKNILNADEGVKVTQYSTISKLKSVFKENGTVTAANSSTINDAASMILLMSEKKAIELGYKPLATIIGFESEGCNPDLMGLGPIFSTNKLLDKLGMCIDDFDLIELNEAFAAQTLAVIKELEIPMNKVNVHGGAISLGHPTGATGAILITKLINDLIYYNKERGLVTLCIGGGMGMSMAIEVYDNDKL